jgi:hypothetical protein
MDQNDVLDQLGPRRGDGSRQKGDRGSSDKGLLQHRTLHASSSQFNRQVE